MLFAQLVGERDEPVLAPGDQHEIVAARCEQLGDLAPMPAEAPVTRAAEADVGLGRLMGELELSAARDGGALGLSGT